MYNIRDGSKRIILPENLTLLASVGNKTINPLIFCLYRSRQSYYNHFCWLSIELIIMLQPCTHHRLDELSWTCHLCHSPPPSRRCFCLTKLSWCTPINIVEIRTDTSDHHEETTVLPISVCMKQHWQSVIIVVWVVILNCCKVSTSHMTSKAVSCADDVWKGCKVFQFTTIKFYVIFFFAWECVISSSVASPYFQHYVWATLCLSQLGHFNFCSHPPTTIQWAFTISHQQKNV